MPGRKARIKMKRSSSMTIRTNKKGTSITLTGSMANDFFKSIQDFFEKEKEIKNLPETIKAISENHEIKA